MVQRINQEDIEKIRDDPHSYLYIRAPMEDDFKVYMNRHTVMICGPVLGVSWYGEPYECVYWKYNSESREVLQVQHLEWISGTEQLQVSWGFTIS